MLAYFLAMLESKEDRQRFTDIYEQYHVQMENVAMRILAEKRDAEDAVQNAFVQVIQHFAKISEIPRRGLPFWLISIVKNEALIIRRKRNRVVLLENWESVANAARDVSNYAELVDLFTLLPDTYRTVLEMKILFGYSDKEISGKLGISETAVSTRAGRGRALLRDIMEKGGFHP